MTTPIPNSTLIFLEHSLIFFGIRLFGTDNGLQFWRKLFVYLRAIFASELLNTSAYLLWIDGRTKQYKRTIVSGLCQYISKHETDWDDKALLFTHQCSCEVYKTSGTTPFSLVLSPEARRPVHSVPSSATGQPERESLKPRQTKAKTLDRLRVPCASADAKAKFLRHRTNYALIAV